MAEAVANDQLYAISEADEARIVGWRVDCFMGYGFAQLPAMALAIRRDVDRQRVKDILDAGATHFQAQCIVL